MSFDPDAESERLVKFKRFSLLMDWTLVFRVAAAGVSKQALRGALGFGPSLFSLSYFSLFVNSSRIWLIWSW